jgi:pilus assembly protein CpaE
MMDAIRVVLIDPIDDSRQALRHLLEGLGSTSLAEVCTTYTDATRAVAEHAPDLALIVLDGDAEAALGLVQELARTHPGRALLPASRARDHDLILRAIRAGAREFLTLPADPQDLLAAIERLVQPSAHEKTRRAAQVIAIVGAAGGVGCTSLAVNLAAELARNPGRSVALADFDLPTGAVDACLDIVPDRTLLEVAQSAERLDLTLLKRSLTRHESGICVLPRPAALEDAARIDPESLRRVVGLLKAAFQAVVIDTSKGLQAPDVVALEMADAILLVVQLDLVGLRNSARLVQTFRQVEGMVDRVRVVINRADARLQDIGPKKVEETLKLPVSWQVPNASRDFATARARGVPLERVAPRGRATVAIAEIARALVPEAATASPSRSRMGRFAALFL